MQFYFKLFNEYNIYYVHVYIFLLFNTVLLHTCIHHASNVWVMLMYFKMIAIEYIDIFEALNYL